MPLVQLKSKEILKNLSMDKESCVIDHMFNYGGEIFKGTFRSDGSFRDKPHGYIWPPEAYTIIESLLEEGGEKDAIFLKGELWNYIKSNI